MTKSTIEEFSFSPRVMNHYARFYKFDKHTRDFWGRYLIPEFSIYICYLPAGRSVLGKTIFCCFTAFEAVLKRFQRVSTGGGVSLEKNQRPL